MAWEHNYREDDNLFVGQDLAIPVIFYNSAATEATIEAGTAGRQDLTGFDLEFSIRDPRNDATAVVTKTLAGGGIVITNITQGEATIYIADTDTDALSTTLDWLANDGVVYHKHMCRRIGAGVETPESFGLWPWRQSMARG